MSDGMVLVALASIVAGAVVFYVLFDWLETLPHKRIYEEWGRSDAQYGKPLITPAHWRCRKWYYAAYKEELERIKKND